MPRDYFFHLATEQRARADVLLAQHVRTVQSGAGTCERQIDLQSARLGFEPCEAYKASSFGFVPDV